MMPSRRSKNLTFPSTLGTPTAAQHTYSTTKPSTLISLLLACGPPFLHLSPTPFPLPPLTPLRWTMVRPQHSLLASPQSTILPIWPSLPAQLLPHHQTPHTHRRSVVPLVTQNLIFRLMTSLRHHQYPNSRPRSLREGCSILYDTSLRSRSRVMLLTRSLW